MGMNFIEAKAICGFLPVSEAWFPQAYHIKTWRINSKMSPWVPAAVNIPAHLRAWFDWLYKDYSPPINGPCDLVESFNLIFYKEVFKYF